MAEQTFRSPNFYDREIDLSVRTSGGPVGVPAGIIGTSLKGPAFVPVTVANFSEFRDMFGDLNSKHFGPYAVNEWLKSRGAVTFLKVLGAGSNSTEAHISTTETTGRVQKAGVKFVGTAVTADAYGRHQGCVQFIASRDTLRAEESVGMPMFTENDSMTGATAVNLIKAVLFMPSTARAGVFDGNQAIQSWISQSIDDDGALFSSGKFKLAISSTLGSTFATTDGVAGVKVYSASLNPSDSDYIGKILNTDPDRFYNDQHYLYAHFPVDDEIAYPTIVGVLSGSANTSPTSGESTTTFRDAFGAYDTRYRSPITSWFISQPFGKTEHELFRFEAIDDGEYANSLYKISISNVKMSEDDSYRYGTFTVEVRSWEDNDLNKNAIEVFANCSLDPNADNYVAKVVGDRKIKFNFDTSIEEEKRLVVNGKYKNNSKYVRIVMSDAVEKKYVPDTSLPFGFKGPQMLKTTDTFTDAAPVAALARVVGAFDPGQPNEQCALSGSIIPPIPFRHKVTKGAMLSSSWPGQASSVEITNPLYYWGVKFERNNSPMNPNVTTTENEIVKNMTKFFGLEKLDVLTTGSGGDTLNNNKFSLSKVVLPNTSLTHLTSTISEHMKEAAYVRNAVLDPTDYTYTDATLGQRITFGTLVAQTSSINFNRFSQFAKFTTFMQGGWDGNNLVDKNAREMTDRASSMDAGGGAITTYVPSGFSSNINGSGVNNNAVASYKTAVDIMTDPMIVNVNVLSIPGQRESYITDHAADRVKDYGLALYVMDIPEYDESSVRLYNDDTARPDVDKTAEVFAGRAIDNSFCATYFPDVYIEDEINKYMVKSPASIAAVSAIAFNDKVSYPWFAPAGFNRASLDFVKNVRVRLNVSDRDTLYTNRINPIATFPKYGYVIYGQKTLKMKKSALDRVNVRRMLNEVKRIVIGIALNITFEQNTVETRALFVERSTIQLGLIQSQAGIERFKVICNETNNSREDILENRLRGRIVVIPTKTIENIAIDFIITNSGIQFV